MKIKIKTQAEKNLEKYLEEKGLKKDTKKKKVKDGRKK